jgi:hypothetical protein
MDWIDLSYYGFALSVVEVEANGELIPRRMIMASQFDVEKPGSSEAPELFRRSNFKQNARKQTLWATSEEEFNLTRMLRVFPQAVAKDVAKEKIVKKIIASPALVVAPPVPTPTAAFEPVQTETAAVDPLPTPTNASALADIKNEDVIEMSDASQGNSEANQASQNVKGSGDLFSGDNSRKAPSYGFDYGWADNKVPDEAVQIYSYDDKRESPIGIERSTHALYESPSGQRSMKSSFGQFRTTVAIENDDISKSRAPTTFLRIDAKESNLEALVYIYVRQAVVYDATLRGADLEQFTRIVFGEDRLVEGVTKINSMIQKCLVDLQQQSDLKSKKRTTLLDTYNYIAKSARLFAHGPALSEAAYIPALPVKVALQRLAVTGKAKPDDRIWAFGDYTMSFALGDSRRLNDIGTNGECMTTDNAVVDLSGFDVLPEEVEIDGFKTSIKQESQLLSLLGKRTSNGRTQFVLRSGASSDALVRHVACRYAIEGRATIDPAMADGDANGTEFYMFLVGVRRPSVLDEPHEAALRIHKVEDWSDLWRWTSTVVSNRSKINKYYEAAGVVTVDGLDNKSGATENYFQVPYVGLSKVAEPVTMVPRNMAGAIRHAMARVQKDIPDVDAWLSNRLGMTINEMGEKLQPEQIDGATMMLHTLSRGYAFLLGDQTGVGKGRSLMTAVATLLNPDPSVTKIKNNDGEPITKILILTQNTTNIGDLFRDIKGLGRLDWFKPAFVNGVMDIRDEVTEEFISTGSDPEAVSYWVQNKKWPEGANVVFGTYSQFNRQIPSNHTRRHQMDEDDLKRAAKAIWLNEVVDKHTMVIMDEAQNALGLKSATGMNARNALEKAGLVVWSSGTHGKDSRSAHLYVRAMPKDIDQKTMMEVLGKGGESMAEVFTSMLAREGTFVRREHDLSRCDYTTFEVSPERQAENRVHMDALAAILSEIAFINGDVQERVNSMNVDIAQQLIDNDPAFGQNPDLVKARFKSMQIRRQSFGSPLYNLSRLFVAALTVNEAVAKGVSKLLEGRKPVYLVENTVENILKSMIDEESDEPQVVNAPDFGTVIRRMVKTMIGWSDNKGKRHAIMDTDPMAMANFVGFRIREVNQMIFDDLGKIIGHDDKESSGAWKKLIRHSYTKEIDRLVDIGYLSPAGRKTAMAFVREVSRAPVPKTMVDFSGLIDTNFPVGGDERTVAFASALSRIEIMIDALPPLQASFIDSLRTGIEEAGFTCGEISGRSLMYKDGMIVPRPKESRTKVRNAFNNGQYDAVIINAAGAVGIDLHAGERFADQRPRTMIPVQAPSDPLILIQALGRIFRYRQTSRPEVLMPNLGLPMQYRFIMMMNAKLGKVSATTTSNREHSAKITTVPDLFSSVGDIVCSNYFEQRPDLMLRMGFDVSKDALGEAVIGGLGDNGLVDAKQQAAEMIAFGDNDGDRKANAFMGRLVMLTNAEQDQIWYDICAEYDAYVQELDAKGMNPLRSQTIEGKVHLKGMTPLSGDMRDLENAETDTFSSEFTKPVFLQNVVIEREVTPVRSEDLDMLVSNGLMRYEMDQVANTVMRLRNNREANLGIWNSTNLPLDMALDQFRTSVPAIINALTNHADKYDALMNAVEQLLPGKKVTFLSDGVPIFGIVTSIKPPASFIYGGQASVSRNYTLASHWDVVLQIPGLAVQSNFSLSSLMSDTAFKIEPGLESNARTELLDAFENSVKDSRLEGSQILTGNLWEAMRLNIRFKLGKLVSWHDESGTVNRGVQVSRITMQKDTLTNMLPTPLASVDSAFSVLASRNDKLKVYGSNDLDKEGLTIFRKNKESWIVSLPYVGDKSYTYMWEDRHLLDRLIELSVPSGDPKAGRNVLGEWIAGATRPIQKITLSVDRETSLRSILKVLNEKGVNFFGTSKVRGFMKEQTAGEMLLNEDAAIRQEERAPARIGRRPPVVQAPPPRRGRREPDMAAHAPIIDQAPAVAPAPPPAPRAMPQAPARANQAPAAGDNPFGFRIIQRPAA